MSETVLVAETGRTTGSANSRRLLREDLIPGVVYGLGMDPVSVSVARRDLRVALSGGAGTNTILDLTVDGTVYPAIVKDMQRHPVRRTVQHVDFLQIDLSQEITVAVPVRMEGEAKEVLANGGLVDLRRGELEITTTPRNIPEEIVVDISELDMDSTITIGDVEVPAGCVIEGEDDYVVVTVLTMRTVEEEEAAEAAEGEEGLEGEEGEEGDEATGEAEGSDDAGE